VTERPGFAGVRKPILVAMNMGRLKTAHVWVRRQVVNLHSSGIRNPRQFPGHRVHLPGNHSQSDNRGVVLLDHNWRDELVVCDKTSRSNAALRNIVVEHVHIGVLPITDSAVVNKAALRGQRAAR
jgi:hypothetical protein